MKLGFKGLNLKHQTVDEFLPRALGQAWDVVDGFVTVEFHALAARVGQRVDHMGFDSEEAQLEDLEQTRRASTHNQHIALDEGVAGFLRCCGVQSHGFNQAIGKGGVLE